MQTNAGVFRIEKTLKDGCNKIDESLQMFNKIGIHDRVFKYYLSLIVTYLEYRLGRNFRIRKFTYLCCSNSIFSSQ